MSSFKLTSDLSVYTEIRQKLFDPRAGGYVSFEGWVRDTNHGKSVTSLEYSAYDGMAVKEGEKILAEAIERFDIYDAQVVHSVGHLQIGDVAVWVGVSAKHRGQAFDACEYIIDELKIRVPIWKNEHYTDGSSGWVECHECSKHLHRKETHEHDQHH